MKEIKEIKETKKTRKRKPKKSEDIKPPEEIKEENKKEIQNEPAEISKPKQKKFNSFDLVIESSNDRDNNTNNAETKKDENIKPVLSVVEETTSLCFVSENTQNGPKMENESQALEDKTNKGENTKNDNLVNEPKEENNKTEEIKPLKEKNINLTISKTHSENIFKNENENIKEVEISKEESNTKDIEPKEAVEETNEKSPENQENNNTENSTPQQPNIPMMFGPGMGGMGMIPIGMPQGGQLNFPNQNKLSAPMQPFMGYNQLNEEEEEDEPDPILDDDTTDLNTINPFALMENTALIVKKNLVEKKWFLMRGEKILGNYNSEQLLYFLTSQIQKGNKFEDMSINDHTTDLHFKPSVLYDTLRKYVPKLKKRYLKKAIEQNNEIMKRMQQQHQILMQNKQMNMIKMMQMKQMQNNNNNNNRNNNNYNNMAQHNNQHYNNHNQHNNHHNNNNYNNYNNYNNKYHNNNNYGYHHNNMNYNNQHQGGNYWNSNKKYY